MSATTTLARFHYPLKFDRLPNVGNRLKVKRLINALSTMMNAMMNRLSLNFMRTICYISYVGDEDKTIVSELLQRYYGEISLRGTHNKVDTLCKADKDFFPIL